jgi:dTDP-glucose 4,6-dehydratase
VLDSLYDCDYIINTAAETHVDNSIISSDEFIHSNIDGVKHLLDLIRLKSKFKMPTLIHFSTDEVYGDIKEGSHTEKDLLKPSNPYAATKAAADMLITAWGRTFNLPYIIIRPTNNYGIGQYPEKLIPKTCKCILLNKKVPLHNHGIPKRIWLHAKDTAKAVTTIIDNNNDGKCLNEIYNIGGNVELPNFEVVKKIHQLMVSPNIQHHDWAEKVCDFNYTRSGQDVRYSLDDSKIRTLGWKNECEFDKELPTIVEFYKNNFIW